ncbi:Os05g0302200 [Oryza sativa Japonica Group]|uniref:Os05g0302200 protein n=1 Tax=Oryza sativa subsp. japonica TaxID=39947 RepID=A0A0P0WKL5_ORYSJ|nr:Os05g0302200 [Oryza sativa Japonica Group]
MASAPTAWRQQATHGAKLAKWTLPFHGRIDYVPEFNLWFGLSAEARRLAAADLSAMDSQPQLVGPWKELNLPEEWRECKDPQLVNLGSGRFCIARFFRSNSDFGNEPIAVFTGVEVVPHVGDANGNANKGSNGKVQLQMIPHRSKCHASNAPLQSMLCSD